MRFKLLVILLSLLLAHPLSAESTESSVSDYTVIVLTSGLDDHVLNTMQDVMVHAPYPGIQVTWQFKLDHPDKDFDGIRRWALPCKTSPDGSFQTEQIAPQSVSVNDTSLVTSFIDWSVQNYPAREYILVMGSHAVGWLPSTDVTGVQTQGALVDSTLPPDPDSPSYIPGYGLSMSLNDQLIALRNSRLLQSGRRFRLVLHDACLMGRAEVLADYAEVADYMIATPEQLLDEGMNYTYLLQQISALGHNATDAEFEQASRRFVDYTVDNGWQAMPDELSTSCFSASLFFCNLRRFGRIAEVVRCMADELVSPTTGFAQPYREAILQAQTNALMYVDDLPRAAQMNSFDLYQISTLWASTGSPRLRALHDSLLVALDDCLYLRLARPVTPNPVLSPRTGSPFSQVSLSLSLFAWGVNPNAVQLASYRRTRFCQLTGLDRFFLINSEQPVVGRTSFPPHREVWHTYY